MDWMDKKTWLSSREGFGEALIELGEKHPEVVVLTADLTESTRANLFREKFPDRFFNFGVAEQNMMSAAAGMSLTGLVPFVCTYGVFASGRCWEQLRMLCHDNCHVIIEGGHAGLLVGPDGASHQATEDLAITRVIPNLTVICPCDSIEAKKATLAAYERKGPVYLRLGREPIPVITDVKTKFKIGECNFIEHITWMQDVTIVATGSSVFQAILAQRKLTNEHIYTTILNCHTIKPLGVNILTQVRQSNTIVTVEEHQVYGGLGSAVAETLSQNYPVPIEMVGIKDQFGQSGQPMELIEHYNLGVDAIIKAVRRVLERKKNENCK